MKKVIPVFRVVIKAFANLKANDPIRMAAATAFFSFFALPPIIIILSQLYGELLDDQNQRVSWQLFRELADLFGRQSARQLQDISQHLQQRRSSDLLTALSVLLLLLASTTLFAIIKSSLNQLWNVKLSANRRFWHLALDKVVALGIIVFSGFLFTASLAIHRVLAPLKEYLFLSTFLNEWTTNAGNHFLSVSMLTVWFAAVFKYLPDIRIHWQAVWVGALVTAVLVEAGEQLLDRLLIKSPVSSLYGRSGAIILILLFVFYASLIFYYGASFTRQYAQWIHREPEPGAHAVAYQIKEVPTENPNLDQEPNR
jgi:membrane protein